MRRIENTSGYPFNFSNLPLFSPFANTERKRALLTRFGVQGLWAGVNERIPLNGNEDERAKPTRVGGAFKNYYETALKYRSESPTSPTAA